MNDEINDITASKQGIPPIEHQFKKGQSGNENGRPVGTQNMSTMLRNILKTEIDIDDPFLKKKVRNPVQYVIMLKLTQRALKGDLKAIEILLDRTEGKAKQFIEHTSGDLTEEEIDQKLRAHAEKLGLSWDDYKKREGLD